MNDFTVPRTIKIGETDMVLNELILRDGSASIATFTPASPIIGRLQNLEIEFTGKDSFFSRLEMAGGEVA